MHRALHWCSQALQCLHFSVSIIGLKAEKRERKESVVPTGQMLLQYVLPPLKDSATMMTSVTAAIIKVGMLRIQTSCG